ncbi:cellulose biosynthesis protein BcsQ [Herbaspirillum frisingense]|uniref:cellulose biosynthesis protein BcsQ n=1 Tax=Herbaspirillum frisingense TaxID=92645 RepID=UPI001EED93F7|nr:cellulose biosynthesis protein BcsQ [Herbaspirillum frisingense]UIN22642.1 cellulose synthase operon protein YhjQ [Herbaspirillum frisingense]
MGNDISNLLSKFGATVDGYLEIEAAIDYKEPVRKPAAPKVVVEAAPAVQQQAERVAEQVAQAAPAVVKSVPPIVVAKSVAPQQRIEPVMDPVMDVDVAAAKVEAPVSVPHPAPMAAMVSSTLAPASSPLSAEIPAQPQVQAEPKVQARSDSPEPQPADAALVTREAIAPAPAPAPLAAALVTATAPAVMPTVVADAAVPSMLRSLLGEVAQQRQSKQAAGANHALASLTPSTPAQVIAIVSPKGGVGKTTLCSALACALARHGRVIAIDLDPQNALQYHLGVSALPEPGSAGPAPAAVPAEAPDWRATWREGSAGTKVVTHDVVAHQGEAGIARQMALDPHWLTRQLQAMDLQPADVVMLDLPAGQSAYFDQALQAADQVVAVVTPDAGSFLALEHMRQALHGRNNCRYIVNKYNAARTFSQDMLEVLKRWMGSRLAGVIALDHAISEGLAYGFNPLVKAGHSPAYDQLRTISEQLHAEVVKSALAGGRAS